MRALEVSAGASGRVVEQIIVVAATNFPDPGSKPGFSILFWVMLIWPRATALQVTGRENRGSSRTFTSADRCRPKVSPVRASVCARRAAPGYDARQFDKKAGRGRIWS